MDRVRKFLELMPELKPVFDRLPLDLAHQIIDRFEMAEDELISAIAKNMADEIDREVLRVYESEGNGKGD